MTGGIGRISAEEFWTGQVRLTPLTSDPADSEEGELWLRADIAEEDDQLGTLRLDTGGSTVDIPVFDVGADVPDDVSTQLRLVVDGQQGFVPTTAEGADIQELGLWSGGVRYGAADGLSAIPDSGVIDNFEDSPDGPYDDETINDFYSIDTESFERVGDNAIEGSKALEITEDVPADTIILSEKGDGLDRYPASGQKLRIYLNSLFDDNNNSPYPYVVFLAEKTDEGVNGYGVGLSPVQNEVSIFKIKDSVSEKLSSEDLSISSNEWFWLEIELPTDDNDIIKAEVYEVSNGDRGSFRNDVVANDNEFADNRAVGFGKHDDDGVGIAFDGFEIL